MSCRAPASVLPGTMSCAERQRPYYPGTMSCETRRHLYFLTMPGSKVWLITGCSRGLGRAFAGAVLEAGHKLVATAREPAAIAEFHDRYGDQVRVMALDVTDPSAADGAVRTAVES